MRILHVLPSDRFSGAENVVCQIMRMFASDADVSMCYCSPDGPIRQALEERDIRYELLKAFTISELRRVLRKYRPDIIHAHDMKAAVLVAFTAGDIPVIAHVHGNSPRSQLFSLKSVLFLLAAVRSKHIFWVSQSAFREYHFHQLLSGKSEILYNIIDADELRSRAQGDMATARYDIVYLGRLSAPKNPTRLLEVIRLVTQKRPETKAALIGAGEMRKELECLARAYGIAENVDFLGFVSKPYGIVRQSRLMLMTSLYEGTPMCALEAMALGVPIVSTPTDGMCEVVSNGETGFLAEYTDELAERCLRILNDDDLRRQMSKTALSYAEHRMDLKVYRSAVLHAYEKALKNRR